MRKGIASEAETRTSRKATTISGAIASRLLTWSRTLTTRRTSTASERTASSRSTPRAGPRKTAASLYVAWSRACLGKPSCFIQSESPKPQRWISLSQVWPAALAALHDTERACALHTANGLGSKPLPRLPRHEARRPRWGHLTEPTVSDLPPFSQ